MTGSFGFAKQDAESQQTSRPTDMTNPALYSVGGPLSEVLKGLLSGGSSNPMGGIPTYGGQTTAAVKPNEQAFLDILKNLGSGQGSGLLKDTIEGKFTDPNSNPFLNDYIKAAQRPTLQGLEETLTRSLPGRFTAGGQFTQPQGSSAFDRAAGIATRGAADAVGDIATKIGFGAYDAERGRQQQGIQLGQAEVETTIKGLQAQALPRLIEQYGLDSGLQQFRDRMNALLAVLGVATSATKPTVGQISQGTSESHMLNMTGSGGMVPG